MDGRGGGKWEKKSGPKGPLFCKVSLSGLLIYLSPGKGVKSDGHRVVVQFGFYQAPKPFSRQGAKPAKVDP
jgi:hypothetical protein